MGYLIRKIARSKWRGCDSDVDAALSADAITNCLKTTRNTLSVWYAADEAALSQAKLALLASQTSVESIDIVVLDEAELLAQQLTLEKTDGKTAAKSLVGLHRDIANLTFDELKMVALIIRRHIVEDKATRIAYKEFKDALQSAVNSNLLLIQDLPDSLAKVVEPAAVA